MAKCGRIGGGFLDMDEVTVGQWAKKIDAVYKPFTEKSLWRMAS